MLLELTSTSDRSAMMRLHARHDVIAAADPTLRSKVALWIDLPLVGLRRGRAWLVAPAERDPLKTSNGRYVIPARPLRELRRIAATGVEFDHIAVAHELDQRGPVRHLVPLLTDGSPTCTDQVARQLVGRVPTHPRVAHLALVMDRFAGGVVNVARAGSAATRRVDRILRDPIIFGVVGARIAPAVGEPALWYPLAAWEW